MDEILVAFSDESKSLLTQMVAVLEKIETDPTHYKELKEAARFADAIMGGAKSIAIDYPPEHLIQKISAFTELCKYIGQQGATIAEKPHLTQVIVAFLLDAAESLLDLCEALAKNQPTDLNAILNSTFLTRLKSLVKIFDEHRKAPQTVSKDSAKSAQDDIDSILKQFGVGG